MQSFSLVTSFTTDRTCFVTFPLAFVPLDELVAAQPQRSSWVFQLTWHTASAAGGAEQTHSAYVGWRGARTNAAQEVVGIPVRLAECLGVPSGVRVAISLCADVLPSLHVELEPAGADDYEVLELNQAFVIDHLLDQVAVLQHGARFPVYVRNALVHLRVVADWHDNAAEGFRERGIVTRRTVASGANGAGARPFSVIGPDSELAIATKLRPAAPSAAASDAAAGVAVAAEPAHEAVLRVQPFPLPPPRAAAPGALTPSSSSASSSPLSLSANAPSAVAEDAPFEGVVWLHAAELAALRARDGDLALLRYAPPAAALAASRAPAADADGSQDGDGDYDDDGDESKTEPFSGPWAPGADPANPASAAAAAAAARAGGPAPPAALVRVRSAQALPPTLRGGPAAGHAVLPRCLRAALGVAAGERVSLARADPRALHAAPAPAAIALRQVLPAPAEPALRRAHAARVAVAWDAAAIAASESAGAQVLGYPAAAASAATAAGAGAAWVAPDELLASVIAWLASGAAAAPLPVAAGVAAPGALVRVPLLRRPAPGAPLQRCGALVTVALTPLLAGDAPELSAAAAAAATAAEGARPLVAAAEASARYAATAAQRAEAAAALGPQVAFLASASACAGPAGAHGVCPRQLALSRSPGAVAAAPAAAAWVAPTSALRPVAVPVCAHCASDSGSANSTCGLTYAALPAALGGVVPLLTCAPLLAPARPVDGALAVRWDAAAERAVLAPLPLSAEALAALGGVAPALAALAAECARARAAGGFAVALVTGAATAGKSSLLARLALAVQSPALRMLRTAWVDCAALAGLRAAAVRAVLSAAVAAAQASAPALLVLDDLDALCPAPVQAEGGAGGDPGQALAQAAVAAIVRDVLERAAAAAAAGAGQLAVVATATAVTRLAPALRQTGLFADATVALKPPALEARGEIIAAAVAALARDEGAAVALPRALAVRLAQDTEGHSPQDIAQLLHRALHAALARTDVIDAHARAPFQAKQLHPQQQVQVQLTAGDLATASAGFVHSALQALSLSAKPQVSWSDIGGLADVKETLVETLELPARFARVFKTVPLKLRSGILLYGPPGCGKTMLAQAVAAQCGLNFISVKGPELLNKYIGASEENVRALFARAAAAAPCVLFFDEFDSIAPKRGGDSTGVTDRVVNQFLCQLDGVEGREGVYVLAASSRPDLIDAALLRPGRLDKAIYCPLPESAAEREAVLRAVGQLRPAAELSATETAALGAYAVPGARWVTRSRRFVLGPDADIAAVAARAVEMTAADLGAVLRNATLAAVREVEAKAAAGGEVTDADERGGRPVVWARHLNQALATTAVSLPRRERERFGRIYSKFIASKTPSEAETEFDPTKPMMTATK